MRDKYHCRNCGVYIDVDSPGQGGSVLGRCSKCLDFRKTFKERIKEEIESSRRPFTDKED